MIFVLNKILFVIIGSYLFSNKLNIGVKYTKYIDIMIIISKKKNLKI